MGAQAIHPYPGGLPFNLLDILHHAYPQQPWSEHQPMQFNPGAPPPGHQNPIMTPGMGGLSMDNYNGLLGAIQGTGFNPLTGVNGRASGARLMDANGNHPVNQPDYLGILQRARNPNTGGY